MSSDSVLDENNWKIEAEAVISDVKHHVTTAAVSETVPSTNKHIFFNIKTLEGNDFCIELSAKGFKIVGKMFDVNNENKEHYFETPYSLLESISPSFVNSFGNLLLKKLETIQSQTSASENDDE